MKGMSSNSGGTPRSSKRSLSGVAGLALIISGVLLLAISGSYFVFSSIAKAQLGNLDKTVAPEKQDYSIPPGWQPVTSSSQKSQTAKSPSPANQDSQSAGVLVPSSNLDTRRASKYFVRELPSDTQITFLADASLGSTNPSPITNPSQYKPASPSPSSSQSSQQPSGSAPPLTGSVEPSALQMVDPTSLPKDVGFTPPATRILIPDIGVDSRVTHLGTVEENGIVVWETPKWSIGHITGTANPGEAGNVVMTGHISSPIRGEGSVFKRLPEVPKLLESGLKVDIIVYSKEAKYLYRVISSKVVTPEEVDVMATTKEPVTTLLTCVPDGVYSHRLVVTAKLIAQAPLEETVPPCSADNPYCREAKQ